ncbi:uncharacterized protein LOC118203955 [Stegodyphus dumicola]|uniref:uncharacterized protein LOC118203955 n=1 Tax=Stegodyphus dumicola TaxID=202533 RepID=UPI0015A96D4A|nr:uncharacterized protein LOC118203955 [Stegodyphus dumicola]
MNSSSVARKNRRMRQMQLPSLSNIRTSGTPLPLYTVDSKVNFSEGCESSDISLNKNESHLNSDSDSIKPKELFHDEGNGTYATTGCSFINCDVSSRPIGKVFVEDESGFKELDIQQMFQPHNSRSPPQTIFKNELAIDLAYKTARHFHSVSNFSHGLLGGMSFLHVLLLFHIMSSESLKGDIIKNFSFLSHPVHNVFNFLCIICIISAFDR